MAQTIDPRELEQFPERFAYDAESGQFLRKHTPEWSAWLARKSAEAAEQRAEDARFYKQLDKLRWQASREGIDPDNPDAFRQWLHNPIGVEDNGEFQTYYSRFDMANRAAKRIDPMDGMRFKHALEVKAAPEGTLTGYLSTFGPPADAYGDIVEKGAFDNTIKSARLANRPYLLPMLMGHDPAKVIGGFSDLHEDNHGLRFTARLNLDTQAGREAHSMLRQGFLDSFSIGYKTIREGWQGNNRLLKEIQLIEGSLVSAAANPAARILMVA